MKMMTMVTQLTITETKAETKSMVTNDDDNVNDNDCYDYNDM